MDRIAGCICRVHNLNYTSLKAIVEAAQSPQPESYTLDEILKHEAHA
jgi:hypothetical protein